MLDSKGWWNRWIGVNFALWSGSHWAKGVALTYPWKASFNLLLKSLQPSDFAKRSSPKPNFRVLFCRYWASAWPCSRVCLARVHFWRHLDLILNENLASKDLHNQRAHPCLISKVVLWATKPCRGLCSSSSSIQCSSRPKYTRAEAVLFSRIALLYSFHLELYQFSLIFVLEPVILPI